MKIYSDRELSVDEQIKIFEKCKQQDLWIRCEDSLSKMFGGSGIIYVKPQMIDKEFRSRITDVHAPRTDVHAPRVFCKYVHADTLELPVSGFSTPENWFWVEQGIQISAPVTTLTTNELFGIGTDSHKKPFIRINGKDTWMLASGPNIGWVYLKVLDVSDPEYLLAEMIPDEYVHADDDSFLEYSPYDMFETQAIPWDEIQAHKPIELLSTEELNEYLEMSEEIYNNPPAD